MGIVEGSTQRIIRCSMGYVSYWMWEIRGASVYDPNDDCSLIN